MLGNAEYRVYLGCYTGEGFTGQGIGLAWPDVTGALRVSESVTATGNPSFLALAPSGAVLYAVDESATGRVVAFAVGPDGVLNELNSQPTFGAAPCHLSVHPNGDFLFVANYVSGNLVVHPIDPDGVLREPCHMVQHSGSGPNPQRQGGPHAHQILPDPSGRHVLAVDLGTDSIYVYAFDADTGHLAITKEAALRPGSGPRHLAFHPSGDRFYLISELASSLTEVGYDPSSGEMRVGETLSTLPTDYAGTSLAAEVVVSPDGRFVFGSNRGHDSIAVASAQRGEFRLLDIYPARVAEPRHISLAATGRTLLVAGQDSSSVQLFAVGDGGELTPSGTPIHTPCPACVLPVPACGIPSDRGRGETASRETG